jgi:hypothetical protein
MATRRSIRIVGAGVVLGLALAMAACGAPGRPGGGPPTPTAGSSATPEPTSTPSSAPTTPVPAYGPVWPLEPRSLSATIPSAAPALKAIRTGRHDTFDRVVFDFTGRAGSVRVRYVPVVRADPSDFTVPLRGDAFLEVTVQGAYARWLGQKPSYAGPDSVTPDYPTLKQVTVSGDFENVLSFGIGVDRTAGFTVARLTSPDRLVIDVAHAPAWQMWPDDSMAQARQVQEAFDAGHVPWRDSVVRYYAKQVYGWPDAVVNRIAGTDEYWVSAAGSTDRIRVHQVWPFAATHAHSIGEIADVR